jgi:hypothetical protein
VYGLVKDKIPVVIQDGSGDPDNSTQSSFPSFIHTVYNTAPPASSSDGYSLLGTSNLIGAGADIASILKPAIIGGTNSQFGIGLGTSYATWKPPSNFLSGIDKDSLAQQIEDLTKTNKKIIGWTLITEDSEANN